MASNKIMSESSKQPNLNADIIFIPQTISDILSEVSMVNDTSIKSSKFDFHIRLLEEELKKVDAFKRELPYCMQLLQDAIEILRKECMRLREREERPTVMTEELMPIQTNQDGYGGVESSLNLANKESWMSRVCLWTAPIQFHNENETFPFQSRGGAIVPSRKPLRKKSMKEGKMTVLPQEVSVPVETTCGDLSMIDGCDLPNQKKQRRCWSPALHNRFMDALLNLGGPYLATPKQIRELMKVEGLTNDEVKSHLQKYRLHIRKLPCSSAGVVDESLTMAADPNPLENNLQNRGTTIHLVGKKVDDVLNF